MLTKQSRLLLALTVATPLVFAGCTDNNILGPGDVAGTYDLTVYSDHGVPFQFFENPGEDSDLPNGGTVIVNSGTLFLDSDGSFVETNNFTKTPTGGGSFNTNFVSIGTFSVNGSNIQLFAPDQNGFSERNLSGTVTGNTVSYFEGGAEFRYQR